LGTGHPICTIIPSVRNDCIVTVKGNDAVVPYENRDDDDDDDDGDDDNDDDTPIVRNDCIVPGVVPNYDNTPIVRNDCIVPNYDDNDRDDDTTPPYGTIASFPIIMMIPRSYGTPRFGTMFHGTTQYGTTRSFPTRIVIVMVIMIIIPPL